MKDAASLTDHCHAWVERKSDQRESCGIKGRYDVVCIGPDGKVKWTDYILNVITTGGKNDVLDKYLLGAAYTQTIRMGLKGAGAAVAGDTQAAHAGWLEVGLANAPTYTGNRKDVAMGAAAAGVSTSPTQAFAITSAGTVAGCFINNGGSATKDDATGVLYSAGDFVGGNKVVGNGDTLNVVYTTTLT
jgi:hypothetical protein